MNVQFVGLQKIISCYAERTALSLLGGGLGLGPCVLGIVMSDVPDWAMATWLLFFVFWLSFGLWDRLSPAWLSE